MKYNFDQIIIRQGTDSGKWDRYGNDVLPLWVADMDFESPAPIGQAMLNRIQHNVFGYGRDPAALRAILCERMQRLYGWAIAPESLIFLPGLVCGLNVVARAIGNVGDNVILNTPIYPPCHSGPTNQGRTVSMVQMAAHLHQGHLRYELDFDHLQSAIPPNTKLFMLCNPHNPIGRAYSVAELTQIGEFCLQHNLTICSDEIHCDLLLGAAKHTPFASLASELANRTITLMAPSKTFNIPGLGCSVAIIGNEQLRKTVQSAASGIVPHANLLGLVATEAAYGDPECANWLDQLRAYLTANRDFVVDYIDRYMPTIKTTVPEATYLAWLDCGETGIEGNAQTFFLEKAKVALNEGSYFGKGGENFVRLNFGCPRPILQTALNQMCAALRTIN